VIVGGWIVIRLIELTLAGLVVVAGMGSAEAADLSLKARDASSATDGWTGFYLGASVGIGPGFALEGDSIHSWVGGFQLGYNYRINWLVVGVEGNFDWAGVRSNFACNASACFSEPEWFATGVARIGVAFDSAMLYVNGGTAWTHDTVTNVFSSDTFLGSQMRLGWTVGAGIEYQVSHNWSVKLEYDYMNFGGQPLTLTDDLGNSSSENIRQQIQLVKLGFDYRFNGSGLGDSTSAMSHDQKGEDDDSPKTIRASSSASVGKDSADGLLSGLIAVTGDVDKSGPRLFLSGAAGWYQFGAARGTVQGVYSTGDILGGYGVVGKNYEFNILAGLSAENDILSTLDPTDPVHGTQGGVKVRGDISVNPTAKTLFDAEAEYATAFRAYYTSTKFGYDFFGKEEFIGPLVAAFGDARYDQWRIGGSISQIKFGKFELDIAAGYAHDSSVGSGAFAEVGLSTDF
jgi:outer membrane immunogenic protein